MISLPTVAAIIPTFNRKDKLCRFLDLMLAQTYPQLQVIVVDSSSSDGTSDFVRKLFSQVTLVEVNDRHFWTGATNAGVKVALGRQVDLILTINDDAIILPDHVSKLVELFQKHHLTILGNRIDYLKPENRVWSLGTHSDWGTDRFLKLDYNNMNIFELPPEILERDLLPVDALPGNGVLIKAEVFDKIGLYNDRFCPHYHGDSEFIMRAKVAGIDAWIAPQIVLANDFSDEVKKMPLKSMGGWKYIFFHPKSHLFMMAILYLIWKYCPRSQKVSTLWSLLKRFQNMKSS